MNRPTIHQPSTTAARPRPDVLAEAIRSIAAALTILADELSAEARAQAPASDDRRLLSVAEAAERLAISEKSLRRLVLKGEIRHRKIGARVLIPGDAIAELAGNGQRAEG